jgi:RNA polymerase sigma-70 factor (ECF subfamily)
VGRDHTKNAAGPQHNDLYHAAVQEFGRILDRIAAGYESDPDKRHDLRQEIHLQLWRSLHLFDARCSLKTWTLRVAHNTAVSWVSREQRIGARLVSLEEIEQSAHPGPAPPDLDRERALRQLSRMILELKPLDRQIMLSYLEDLDAAAIADITGLSAPNVAMKIHRIKNILARRFQKEQHHA